MCGCWGACVVVGGMHGCGGGVWLWGVHGCRGHVWLHGVCVVAGDMCGCGGHAWLQGGVCGCGGACVGPDEIWSMSGLYASYWNAFLLVMLSSSMANSMVADERWPSKVSSTQTRFLSASKFYEKIVLVLKDSCAG